MTNSNNIKLLVLSVGFILPTKGKSCQQKMAREEKPIKPGYWLVNSINFREAKNVLIYLVVLRQGSPVGLCDSLSVSFEWPVF